MLTREGGNEYRIPEEIAIGARYVVLEGRSCISTTDDLAILGRCSLEDMLSAFGCNLLQELGRTACMTDSVARNESKGVECMLSTRSPRGPAYSGLFVVLDIVEFLVLSLRAVWR